MRPSKFTRWWRRTFQKHPPDPAMVSKDQVTEAIMARVEIDLKPWPNLPDDHYLNTLRHICTFCGRSIYSQCPVCYDGWEVLCGVCYPQKDRK